MCKFDFVQVCVSVQKNRSSTGKTISYVFEMVIGHSSLNIYWKYIQLYKFVISYSYSYEVSCVQISLCPGVRPCPKKFGPTCPGPAQVKKCGNGTTCTTCTTYLPLDGSVGTLIFNSFHNITSAIGSLLAEL